MSARGPEREAQEPMGFTTRGARWERRQLWCLAFFLTFVGYWVPLVYMGLRVLQFRWVVYGLLYALPVALLALVLASGGAQAAGPVVTRLWQAVGGFWFIAAIHAWNARGEFLQRRADQEFDREDLQARLRERAAPGDAPEAPPPRRLLGVNRATEQELAMLPGLGPERARQALRLREEMGEYRSFADLAHKLQLPAETRARLRPLFEPDSEEVALAVPKDDPAYRVLPDGRRVLELNWASPEALGALPGLGPELARRAVALRDDGPFKSLEDFRFRLNLPMDAMIKISPYVSVISMSMRPGGGGGAKTGGRIVDV